MKNVISLKPVLAVLLMALPALGFKTFTEKVNPFNRFLNPVDGVDLYSGNAAFTKTLYTMKGRNGLDIGINLKYSSNVYVNVRARNDVAPTGALGLGWNLSYGSIRSDHKGTRNPADDDFFWESPDGYSRRLFVEFPLNDSLLPAGTAKCGIEEMPYVKVTCVYDSVKRQIRGWKIKKNDGTTLTYGDLSSDTTIKATRKTFACGNYIEPAINAYKDSGTTFYTLYPYQWDLSDIADNFGNHIVFKYRQETEPIRAKRWDPPQVSFFTTRFSYTKSSYIKTIINPEGKRIEFGVTLKDSNEYYDPYKFEPEPDAFIEKIEKHLFDTINIYNSNDRLIKQFVLCYKKINQKLPPSFLKSLLTEIREYGSNNLLYNKDVFTYYDDFAKGDEDSVAQYDSSYNYGALETHKDMKGYVVKYEYERAELIATKTKSDNHQMPTGILNWYGDINMGRITASAYPFGVISTRERCCTYTWNGGKWDFQDLSDSVPNALKTSTCDTNMIASAGNEYFVLLGGKITESRKFCVFIWDEEREKWVLDKSIDGADSATGIYNVNNPPLACAPGNNYFSDVRVFGAPGYFLVVDGNRDGSNLSRVFAWNRIKNGNRRWKMNMIGSFNKIDNPDYKVPLVISIAANTFAVSQSGLDYHLYNWDGMKWSGSTLRVWGMAVDWFYYTRMQINNNNFNTYRQTIGTKSMPKQQLHKWDGDRWLSVYDSVDWRVKKDFFSLDNNHLLRFIPRSNADPFYSGGSWDILSWQGNNWRTTISKAKSLLIEPGSTSIAAFLHENYSIFVLMRVSGAGVESNKHYRLLWKTNDKMWHFQRQIPPPASGSDTLFDNNAAWQTSASGGIFKWPRCVMENDFFIAYSIQGDLTAEYLGNISKSGPVKSDVYVWNGIKWSRPFGASTSNFPWQNVMDVKTTNDAVMLLHRNIDTANHSKATVTLYYKFQNSFNDTIYTYTLSQKTFSPGFGQSTERVSYFYDTCTTRNCNTASRGNYDTRTGSARFNKVEVRLANNAKKIVYFYNHTVSDAQDTLNPDYKKLDGLTYRSENTDSSGVDLLPTSDTTVYQVYKDTSWLTGVYDRRVTGQINRLDRVRTDIQSDYRLNAGTADINGLPRYRYVRNSDGDTIREYTLFAHERPEYAAMAGDLNIIDQPCLKLVLENWTPVATPATNWYGNIGKTYIRKATAITWDTTTNPAGIWAPANVYIWNVRRNSAGIPDSDFTGFNFANPASRSNAWEFVSAITRYNRYGQVMESRKPVSRNPDLYSATYYRDDMALPVASVINARQCGATVTTCDHEEALVLPNVYSGYDNPAYLRGFYLGNGWFKPVTIWSQCYWSVIGTCELVSNKRHFGQKCLYVRNSPGPTTRLNGGEIWNGNLNCVFRDSAYVQVDPAKRYVFSAWVNPSTSDPVAFTVEVYENRIWRGAIFNTTASLGLATNAWSLVSFPISFAGYPTLDPADPRDGVELTVGRNGDSASVEFYIDDIRFYPKDAFITTTYYDTLWEKPVVSVDANNAPGAKIEYERNKTISKQEMLENKISSHDAEGATANYTGRIGADALGTNIYYDEIWQKPKVLMRDDPAGRIEYDEHGREKRWYKMAYRGSDAAPDTLILEKKYNMAGIRP